VDGEGKECEEIYVVEDYNIRYFDYQCYRFVFDAELQYDFFCLSLNFLLFNDSSTYYMVPDRSKDWTLIDAEMLGGGLKSGKVELIVRERNKR
jgi:hypothetical protein